MFGLSLIIGPLFGGLLMDKISLFSCFLFAALISIIDGIICILFLEETIYFIKERPVNNIQYIKTESLADDSINITVIDSNNLPTNNSCNNEFFNKINPIIPIMYHLSNKKIREMIVPLIISNANQGIYFIWFMFMKFRYNSDTLSISIYLSFAGLVIAVGTLLILLTFNLFFHY